MKTLTLRLPFPPSINHYWRRVGPRTLISRQGRQFREYVVSHCARYGPREGMHGRLELMIEAYPPDMRRRDLDNLFKSVLDALEHAGVYQDDAQIDALSIYRRHVTSGGAIEVTITALDGDE